MGYRLERNESVPENLRRIAHEQLSDAAGQLVKKTGAKRAEGIHEARKSIKKVRAILRLMRPELRDTFAKENRRLRAAGRKLSEFRDATAIIEIFDDVRRRHASELPPNAYRTIRAKLVARRREAERRAGIAATSKRIAESLKQIDERVDSWPLQSDGFAAVGPGLEASYRAGRKALAEAQRRPGAANYHEWRKRVKDHWYHIRLIEDFWTDVMLAHEKSLKDLETWLGDDHNLVVLRETLRGMRELAGMSKQVAALSDLMDEYQKELRGNAVSLGLRLYEEKPRIFTERMQHLWDVWQAEPKSLEQFEKQQRRPAAAKRPSASRLHVA